MALNKKEGQDQSGLLNNSEPVFLAVARIHKPHGLKGEVSVDLLTDFPERLIIGKQVYIGENHIPSKIDSIRKMNKKYLILFIDHHSRDSVDSFRNEIVYIREKGGLPSLPNHEYYHHDLIGMTVFSIENKQIGILADIIQTGANDVYVIKPHNQETKEILIPAIKSVVKKVDIQKKEMIVKLQEWH